MPVMGLVRFSILFSKQNFFTEMKDKSLEERWQTLFAPARMEARFTYFEALTLPSLTAQPDGDWRAVVFYSSEMPAVYRDRLMDMLAPHKHLGAVSVTPDQLMSAAIREELDRYVPDRHRLRASFRLDDDDAMSARFMPQLWELLSTYGADQTALSFARGHYLKAEPGEGFRLAESIRNFGIGCGLTLIGKGRNKRDVYNLGAPHRRVDQAFPTIADARAPVFLCTAHTRNDSGTGSLRHAQLDKSRIFGPKELKDRLGPDFAHVDMDALAAFQDH